MNDNDFELSFKARHRAAVKRAVIMAVIVALSIIDIAIFWTRHMHIK